MSSANDESSKGIVGGPFATTHWSVVLAAGTESSGARKEALENLCAAYWYPLYAHVRRQGFDAHRAEDLTQDFFAWLLESEHLRVADRERGKFRSFLLVRLNHFLADERRKARAQKRGGGQHLIQLDAQAAEERYRIEPATRTTPEELFDARWALTLLERSVARLQAEYAQAGRSELFKHIRVFQLADEPDTSYVAVAERLALSVAAVKSAIYRLRQRHAELLRDEIAQTVATPADVEEEVRYLVSMLVN